MTDSHSDQGERPPMPAIPVVPLPDLDRLPVELRDASAWMTWRAEWVWRVKEAKWALNKSPCDRKGGFNRGADDETGWSCFAEALIAVRQLRKRHGTQYGLGFSFYSKPDVFCLDLDGDAADGFSDRAMWLASNYPTWAERSVSGKGLHLFYRGKTESEEFNWKGSRIEIFGHWGFIAVTGDCTDHIPPPMADGTGVLSVIKAQREPDKQKEERQTDKQHTPRDDGTLSPGDDFDLRGSWQDVLEPHGWSLAKGQWDCGTVTRPGKDGGVSASIGTEGRRGSKGEPLFVVYSDNAQPFEKRETYGRFRAYAYLNHGKDLSAAAKELAAKGYGKKSDGFKQRATGTTYASTNHDTNSGQPPQPEPIPQLVPIKARDLILQNPRLRPAVIEGLLREGETMNVIASPKVGKSWLDLNLSLSVACGLDWLGHKCTQGNVLILDNELHAETIASRLKKVADAMTIGIDEYGERLAVQPLRGCLRDLRNLGPYFDAIEPGQFKLIVIDAWYRVIPIGLEENSNGDVAYLYNLIDHHAGRIGCSFVLIHHTTKGSQVGKSTTDIGAGAGSQSRATDAHVVLRQHEQPGIAVMEAAVRSWAPLEAKCLRWDFPLWHLDREEDPTRLAGAQKRTDPVEKKRKDEEEKAKAEQAKKAKKAAEFEKLCESAYQQFLAKPSTVREVRGLLHLSGDKINEVMAALLKAERLDPADVERPNGKAGKGKSTEPGYQAVSRDRRDRRDEEASSVPSIPPSIGGTGLAVFPLRETASVPVPSIGEVEPSAIPTP